MEKRRITITILENEYMKFRKKTIDEKINMSYVLRKMIDIYNNYGGIQGFNNILNNHSIFKD